MIVFALIIAAAIAGIVLAMWTFREKRKIEQSEGCGRLKKTLEATGISREVLGVKKIYVHEVETLKNALAHMVWSFGVWEKEWRPLSDMLFEMACNVIDHADSPTERVAAAQHIFGRWGVGMLPILERRREQKNRSKVKGGRWKGRNPK